MPVTSSAVNSPSSASSGSFLPSRKVFAPANASPDRSRGFSACASRSNELPSELPTAPGKLGGSSLGPRRASGRKKPWVARCELRRRGHHDPIYYRGALERLCNLYGELGVDLG